MEIEHLFVLKDAFEKGNRKVLVEREVETLEDGVIVVFPKTELRNCIAV